MTNGAFAGKWTYRSFHNTAGHLDDINGLLFGEGDLELAEPATGKLFGTIRFGTELALDVQGSSAFGEPFVARFRGVGRDGTKTAGWIYDYVGFLNPHWPHGARQIDAFVGTVIRSAPHNDRPAGVVASFIAVRQP